MSFARLGLPSIYCCFIYSEIIQGKSLFLKISTNACKGKDTEVNYLEHVQAVITANASRRGDLELFLTSPMGTRSMILSKRANDDDHRDGFTKWPFMTTHTWGEYPQGTWGLEVKQMEQLIFLKNSILKWSKFFYTRSLG